MIKRMVMAVIWLTAGVLLGGEDRLPEVRVGRLAPSNRFQYSNYPGALESLLLHVRQVTLAKVVPEPVEIRDFADPKLLELPFIYANFADRQTWVFTPEESRNLKAYLERGGCLLIDAGITAEFLRQNKRYGQHHSYAEWEPHPTLAKAFGGMFPSQSFVPLKRSHSLFSAFYKGLPDASKLPEKVRKYTVEEKWPEGTYATLALQIKDRPAVLVTPILAMGWGRNPLGQWSTVIKVRILEDTEGLTGYVKNASYSGKTFKVKREDSGWDQVYCERLATPSWLKEPSGRIRMFRYYGSPEISDFAHEFYTRLGTNIMVYCLTH